MRICELMEQRGIQRIQLADAMGVSPSCITKWVKGTALPSADKLPLGVQTGRQTEKGVAYDPYRGGRLTSCLYCTPREE